MKAQRRAYPHGCILAHDTDLEDVCYLPLIRGVAEPGSTGLIGCGVYLAGWVGEWVSMMVQ